MDYDALNKLVQKRAGQAYQAVLDAGKIKNAMKRATAMQKALRMQAACEVCADILGERNANIRDQEERIKALFLETFFTD